MDDYKELVARLRGERLNCECHARSCWECCCDTHWPESYCKDAAEAIERLSAEVEAIQQAISDPENQPSQYGTVTIDYMADKQLELAVKYSDVVDELAALKSASAEPVAEVQKGQFHFLKSFVARDGTKLYLHPAPAAVQEDAKDAAYIDWTGRDWTEQDGEYLK